MGHWPHGHNPHRHKPHGHNPHGHNPHVHTPYPTPHPTNYPTAAPTKAPTLHPCTDGSHGCDKGPGGICYPATDGSNGWTCACHNMYWCSNGCSAPHTAHQCIVITPSPTTYPTPYPTSYPTSMPTPAPTPAPTAYCPVTCKIHTKADSVRRHRDGSGKIVPLRRRKDSVLGKETSKYLQTEHHTFIINEQSSYTKHRCYTYKGKCVCECLGASTSFQENTRQGVKAKMVGHRGWAKSDKNNVFGNVFGNQKIQSDIAWVRPHAMVTDREVKALRQCCEKEFIMNPDFILPAHSCKDVRGIKDHVIRKRIAELKISNKDILDWLVENKCYHSNQHHQYKSG